MLNNVYIAVPFAFGLSAVFFSTAKAIKENKKSDILGHDKFLLCTLHGDDCVSIKGTEEIPIKVRPPLGMDIAVNKREINCLARNITQEAGGSTPVDRTNVGFATINRIKAGYARSLCTLIKQYNVVGSHRVYQMSWYGNPKKRYAPPNKRDVDLARKLLSGEVSNPSPDCLITNWYNTRLDSRDSFNAKHMLKRDVCSYRPKGSDHIFIEVTQ